MADVAENVVEEVSVPKEASKDSALASTKEVKPVEAPTEAVKPVETPTEAVKPVESPTKAVKPVEAPTEAVKPVEAPTEAVKPAEAPTEAVKSVEAPNEEANAKETAAATESDEPSKLERDIIRQIEYYFGDANLRRDKFLLDNISKDKEGWVPLSVLLTFKRLAALSTDAEVIVNALVKSDEGLIEISEDKQKLRRHPERPLPELNEERRKEIMSRTAYAKGFPLNTTMAELLDFFSGFVKVDNINMRKYLDKPTKTYKFKGSVFVTFEKKEQSQEFVEKDKVVYKERELLRKSQEAYVNEKKEELRAKAKKKAKAEEEKPKLPKGAVLHFEGATGTVTREILRQAVVQVEGDFEVAYIDYSKGDKEGHIRFVQENSAAKFLEKLEDKKLKLSEEGVELTLRELSEEEEKAFIAKALEDMKNRRVPHNRHKGNHYGNRKRRGNENRNDEKKRKKPNDE